MEAVSVRARVLPVGLRSAGVGSVPAAASSATASLAVASLATASPAAVGGCGHGSPVEYQQRLAPGRRPAGDGAVGAVATRIAVEHQDVLAVVLRPHLVHVEERHRRARHRLAHHAVALVVLLPGPGRRGQVDDEVGPRPMPGAQRVEGFVAVAVVLVPDVFTELHPEPHHAAGAREVAGDVVGDHPVGDGSIGLRRDLAQGVEVTVVVEEPVVRVQRLRMHAMGQRGGQSRPLHEAPVVTHPCRVELPDPAVFADGVAIDRDVAEHDGDAAARVADLGAPALVVLDERVDLPGVAQDVPRDAHFGKRDDRRPRIPRSFDETEHGPDIEVRPPRAHLHLRQRDGWKGGGRKVDGHDGIR